jgi:integrase
MTNYRFTILTEARCCSVPYEERVRDHDAVLSAYFRTFEKRRYVGETLQRVEEFLTSVFQGILIQDESEGNGRKHLLIWDLLHPIDGPQAIDLFATSLNRYDYCHSTVMKYLGDIRRLCDFVLAKPYIPGRNPVSVIEKYGAPAQPVSQYDRPVHAIDNLRLDPALVGESLKQFLDFVRVEYVGQTQSHAAQRNYAMIVLAVSGGMRANELLNLDIDDLRFKENRVWIRYGKGHKGSGKRQRLTLFTKFAQATVHVYQTFIRPQLEKPGTTTAALFLTENGDRITYDSMRLALLDIGESARQAGIKLPNPFGWHDLRRSFATEYLEERPGGILKLSSYMGHTGLGTLHRYVRPSRAALYKATDALLARTLPKKVDS